MRREAGAAGCHPDGGRTDSDCGLGGRLGRRAGAARRRPTRPLHTDEYLIHLLNLSSALGRSIALRERAGQ